MPTFNLSGSISVTGSAEQIGALITALINAIPPGVTVTMDKLSIAPQPLSASGTNLAA